MTENGRRDMENQQSVPFPNAATIHPLLLAGRIPPRGHSTVDVGWPGRTAYNGTVDRSREWNDSRFSIPPPGNSHLPTADSMLTTGSRAMLNTRGDSGFRRMRSPMKAGLNNRIGHYYYRARFYAAHLGRFCSRDLIGYRAGTNAFEYVGDSPIIWVDPSGHQIMIDPGGPLLDMPPQRFGNCWLTIDKHEYELILKTGCVGLCMLRCGTGDTFPHLAPNTRCFLTYESALLVLQQYQAAGTTATLFAVQDRVGIPFGSAPSAGCELPDEFDPHVLRLLDYNFCTLVRIGDQITWEWMDSGYDPNDLDLRNRFEHGAPAGSGEASSSTGPGGAGKKSAEKSP